MPFGLVVAQVAKTYPGAPLYGPYPTRDGSMPWRLFWELYERLPAMMALDRLNQSSAARTGQELAWGVPEARETFAKDRKEAFGG